MGEASEARRASDSQSGRTNERERAAVAQGCVRAKRKEGTLTEREREREMTISVTVQPRVQREKWSLYWKESMMTKTDLLDPIVLKVDEKSTKVEDLLQMVSARMSWPPKADLLRLEGFEEPWETCVLNGKACMEGQTLTDCGITKENNTVTTVRKVLVAEGKRIKTGGLDDSDTDEDDF